MTSSPSSLPRGASRPKEQGLRVRLGASLSIIGGVLLVASAGTSCNLDPVHRAGVNNLGDEQSALYPPESEFHRPGEPCALCHSTAGPADTVFALAGTIFWGPDNYDRRVDQAYVRVAGPDHTTKCFVTNCNGNFYISPDDYPNLKFPLLVSVERVNKPGGKGPTDEKTLAIRRMGSHIGREASCATCHILALHDYGSPGQIHMYDSEAQVMMAKPPIPAMCPNTDDHVTQCPEDRP